MLNDVLPGMFVSVCVCVCEISFSVYLTFGIELGVWHV